MKSYQELPSGRHRSYQHRVHPRDLLWRTCQPSLKVDQRAVTSTWWRSSAFAVELLTSWNETVFYEFTGICAEKCLNRGKCIQKDTCQCPKGYYGLRCELCKSISRKSWIFHRKFPFNASQVRCSLPQRRQVPGKQHLQMLRWMVRESLWNQTGPALRLPEALQEWNLSADWNMQVQERLGRKVLQQPQQTTKKHLEGAQKIRATVFNHRLALAYRLRSDSDSLGGLEVNLW